jgi:hypothetical protein
VIALLSSLALAGPVADGAAAFSEGKLDDAIDAWEEASRDGSQASGIISYNLGIAWYRKGDFPRSIANFRAAARLRPRDPSVLHNLALARAGLGVVPDPVTEPGWTQVATPGEVGVLGVMLTALGSAGVLGSVFLRRWPGGRLGWGLLLGVGLVWGLLGVGEAQRQRRHPVAVLVGPEGSSEGEVVARDSASINAGERHRWPLGTELRVERTYEGFVLLEDGRGRRGWVPTNAVTLAW